MRRLVTLAAVLATTAVAPAGATDLPIPGPSVSPLPELPRLDAAQPPGRCTIEGGNGPDRLTGTDGPDVICGNGGDDVLEGLAGDDVLDGGDGVDTATWETATCCVRANLESGFATGSLGADEMHEIENLTGSQGTDVLRGNAETNAVVGLGESDLLFGGEGDDVLVGGEGDDWLAGEGGTNALDGGTGANVCADGAGTGCAPLDPGDPGDTRGPLDVAIVDTAADGDANAWRIGLRSRVRPVRLWDDGYVVLSFDTRGGPDPDVHAVARWDRKRTLGLLVRDGQRSGAGRIAVRRSGPRGVLIDVPLARLGLDPLRLYYRWSARSIFIGNGCRPCFDTVPENGAYPQPLVNA